MAKTQENITETTNKIEGFKKRKIPENPSIIKPIPSIDNRIRKSVISQ